MDTQHQPEPDNIRLGAPYDNPAFEALCREHDIWGKASAALCAVFWRKAGAELAAKEAALAEMANLLTALNVQLASTKVCDLVQVVGESHALHVSVVPAFAPTAERKLNDLLARGYEVTGYSFAKRIDANSVDRGFVTHGGLVGWWRNTEHETEQVASDRLRTRIAELEAALARAVEQHITGVSA